MGGRFASLRYAASPHRRGGYHRRWAPAALRSRPPIMRFEPAIFPHNQVRYAMKNRGSTAAPIGGGLFCVHPTAGAAEFGTKVFGRGGQVIRMRLLATAFLINGDSLLLMRRSSNARLFAGKWAPIGGHLEAYEMNDPQEACLREIGEETGLADSDLVDLSLKYVVHRRRRDEIRVQYVHFGYTSKRDVGGSEEGELHWVGLDSALDLDMSATTRFTLEHYMKIGSHSDCIYVGAVDAKAAEPVISWAALRDWE
jgi:8-oxo-dGTP diphosphatase